MRMMLLVWILSLLTASACFAAFAVGDEAPNLCWDDANAQSVCLHDSTDNIRILFYLNGHCPSCETLLNGLMAQASQFKPSPVDFLALYTEGESEGDAPSGSFLSEAAEKLQAPATGKLLILASPDDAGLAFYELPDWPTVSDVIILGTDDTIASISLSPTAKDIVTQIQTLEKTPPSTPTSTSTSTLSGGAMITSLSR